MCVVFQFDRYVPGFLLLLREHNKTCKNGFIHL
uniref:Uncharacterized protein n=1 Tax=Anguilla anguilla TaxID=7936 RepID=A0A0E9Q3Z8_ANGAN